MTVTVERPHYHHQSPVWRTRPCAFAASYITFFAVLRANPLKRVARVADVRRVFASFAPHEVDILPSGVEPHLMFRASIIPSDFTCYFLLLLQYHEWRHFAGWLILLGLLLFLLLGFRIRSALVFEEGALGDLGFAFDTLLQRV